jgi:hypothetical protein
MKVHSPMAGYLHEFKYTLEVSLVTGIPASKGHSVKELSSNVQA